MDTIGKSGLRVFRAVIIDDHEIVARGLELLLAAQPDIEVAEIVTRAGAAIAAVARLRPDVATLDLAMPGIHGADLIEGMRCASPGTRIIVLTGLTARPLIAEVLARRPQAVLQKQGDPAILLDAIRTPRNETVLCPEIMRILASQGNSGAGEEEPIRSLTRREQEIAGWLARGMTTREIALALNLSEHTVRKHRENTMQKLGVKTTGQLIALASQRGYI